MILVQFKVQPYRKSWLYFTVTICDTIKAMQEYAAERTPPFRGRFHGLCTSWLRERWTEKGKRTHPEMGEILLCKKYLGAGTVSHECTHAALAWARRIRMDFEFASNDGCVDNNEEALCYAQGNMVKAIYTKLYKHNII